MATNESGRILVVVGRWYSKLRFFIFEFFYCTIDGDRRIAYKKQIRLVSCE